MSDPTPAAPAAPTSAAPAAPAQGGTPAPETPAAPIAGITPAPETPALVGQAPVATPEASTPAQGTPNSYEERYSQIGDAEGNFTDGTRAYLTSLGMDSGRVDRIMRQGNLENTFKALDHSQSLIEKRDGVREYIPDPADETRFNQWRTEKGIPLDPSDPQNGYNLKAGLPEGVDPILGEESLGEVAKMLHASNMPKDQANALIEQVNAGLLAQTESLKATFTDDQIAREQASYNDFMQKHGFEADKKSEQVGLINKTYGIDPEDPSDRLLMTNPKYLAMAVDLASLSRLTPSSPESGGGQGYSSGSPDEQIQKIMKDNPRGAWKRDSNLSARMETLAKQAEAIRNK